MYHVVPRVLNKVLVLPIITSNQSIVLGVPYFGCVIGWLSSSLSLPYISCKLFTLGCSSAGGGGGGGWLALANNTFLSNSEIKTKQGIILEWSLL